MKKIFKTMLLVLAVLGVASCNSGEIEYKPLEKSIKIVSQNVTDMKAIASQGEIVFEAAGAVTATTTSDWLTVSVSGNKVNVQTTDNLDLDYRSAKITLKSGDDSVYVTVLQQGAVVSVDGSVYMCKNKGELISVPFQSNLPITFTSTASWLSYEVFDNTLAITVSPNNTGDVRLGFIRYKAGNSEGSITVRQGELSDLLGDFYLGYQEDGETTAIPVNISAGEDKTYNMTFALTSKLQFVAPVTLDANDLSITLNAGANMGKYSTYDIYLLAVDFSVGNLTWSEKVSATAHFIEFDFGTETVVAAPFMDNRSWSNYTVDGFQFGAFKGAPSGTTYAGGLVNLESPMLLPMSSLAAKKVKIKKSILP